MNQQFYQSSKSDATQMQDFENNASQSVKLPASNLASQISQSKNSSFTSAPGGKKMYSGHEIDIKNIKNQVLKKDK